METKTKLPPFKGKPLIEIPTTIPSANFLEGDFGKAVLEEYQGRANKDYANASALNVLSYKNEIVRGSNPFAVVLVNQIVGQEGLRTATQADLERVLRANALLLKGQYEDSALVLRTGDNPNEYLARNLMTQVKARLGKKAKMPSMIPLSELELAVDENSPHKLRFILKDSAQVFYDLPIFNEDGNFSSENIDEKTGLLTKVGNEGDRTLYTRNSGLSRLYLGRYLNLYSDDVDLGNSGDSGRVVVVSAEGTNASQNLIQERLSSLQRDRDAEISNINARYQKAEAILKGK